MIDGKEVKHERISDEGRYWYARPHQSGSSTESVWRSGADGCRGQGGRKSHCHQDPSGYDDGPGLSVQPL